MGVNPALLEHERKVNSLWRAKSEAFVRLQHAWSERDHLRNVADQRLRQTEIAAADRLLAEREKIWLDAVDAVKPVLEAYRTFRD
jgi:hypothetical protein